jgi:fatty-acyl-CoA synthase
MVRSVWCAEHRGSLQPLVDYATSVRQAAVRFSTCLAVDDGVRAVTFAELVARAERFANALTGLGAVPGTAVGILSENCTEYIEADCGIAFARCVRVALNARLHTEDHTFVAGDSGMRVLIHSERYAAEASALRDLGIVTMSLERDADVAISAALPTSVDRGGTAEDPAWITYTSGTTGRPKGVVLSCRSIAEVARNLLAEFGVVAPGELIVLPQPLSHGAGYFVLPWLMSGGGLYVMRSFDPDEVYAVGARPEARTLKCVPAMLPSLLERESATSFGYDSVIYGASPVSRPVLEEALARFGPILSQIYGQSEAPVTITCLPQDDHLNPSRQSSAGRAFARVNVDVRDPDGATLGPHEIGEVAVIGPQLMTRYHGLPDATAAVFRNGWVMTRDLGYLDEAGYLHLRGRSDEMIISGGFNIAPREVEIALAEFSGVEEVAVAGVPDEEWGTAVTAMVKLRDGADVTPADVVGFAKRRLGFRTPKLVTVVDAIPKNAYGKVDRALVVAALTEAHERHVSGGSAQ